VANPITIEDIYELFRRSQAEADERFRRSQTEADRRAAEADRRIARLEQIAANTSREVAGLTTRWGQFVENLVEPAVVRLFQARGLEVQETSRRLRSQRPGAEMEIDILAVNGDIAVAIEVKSRLSRQDVEDFLVRLPRFKQAFPQYGSYHLHGAVAGIEIDAGVDRYAYQQGLFVIKRTGDTVTLANDLKFQPTAW
jgi:predicted RecB family endonuclease